MEGEELRAERFEYVDMSRVSTNAHLNYCDCIRFHHPSQNILPDVAGNVKRLSLGYQTLRDCVDGSAEDVERLLSERSNS